MSKLTDFVKTTDFGGDACKLPEGKTIIVLEDAEVIVAPFTDIEGKTKPRWKIKTKEATYYVGVAVMAGIKKAMEKGAKKVEIIRDGTDKNTKYVVLPA